ncbi:MAG: glycosyltransferase [Candidatus Hydrogenedentes bacterium]|nr:glycosyltransferase [Candidatus Hydrogenedentota bacterium]
MITVAHLDEQRGLRGGEQQAAWLVKGLADRGFNTLVIGRAREEFIAMHPDRDDLQRVALPLRGELDLYSAWKLARITKRLHVDIVHGHTSHAHGIAVLAKTFGMASHVVASRRVNFMPKGHVLNRWKYRQADRILCVSEKVEETLNTFGLQSPRIGVVHSAVDMERAMMTPVSRTSLGVPEDAPLLISAGALVDHKDHANLLDAVVKVRTSFPTVQVCIAGEGTLRGALETQRDALGLRDCVTFLGYRADAPGIIRAGDVYVSSSWSEGLGTSILEALASGVPVVAAEAGGAKEMVIPNETGHLVPVRDASALAQAIIAALTDRDGALRMAEAGRRIAQEKFSVERMVEQTIAVYQELMQA